MNHKIKNRIKKNFYAPYEIINSYFLNNRGLSCLLIDHPYLL
jgi:hypothetical protein